MFNTILILIILFSGFWAESDKNYVNTAIKLINSRFLVDGISFKEVFKVSEEQPFVFNYYNIDGIGGVAQGIRTVSFYGFYRECCYGEYQNSSINLVIHELGHVFEAVIINEFGNDFAPYKILAKYKKDNINFPDHDTGYYTDRWNYRQATYTDDETTKLREEFADMFIAYIRNRYEDSSAGRERKKFMDRYMNMYLMLLGGNSIYY